MEDSEGSLYHSGQVKAMKNFRSISFKLEIVSQNLLTASVV
jgi:hypothetical protein